MFNRKKDKKAYHDKRKKFVIVFDTETTMQYVDREKPKKVTNFKSKEEIYNAVEGSIQEYEYRGKKRYSAMITKDCITPVFDLGYTICSIDGNTIYEKRNFLIDEIFTDTEAMRQAHYFEKYPNYIRKLARQEIQLANWIEVKHQLEKDIINYRIETMWAYNVNFDKSALEKTNQVILKTMFDLIITYNIQFGCLWGWACETILQNKNFITQALNQNWLSDGGNIKTSAEVCYRYLTQNLEFIEDHTALSDAIIETEIYKRLKKTRKPYSFNLNQQPWALVKKKGEEIGVLPIIKNDMESF